MSPNDTQGNSGLSRLQLVGGEGLTEMILDPRRPAKERRAALHQLGVTLLPTPGEWKSLLEFIEEFRLIDDPDGEVASLAIQYASVLSPTDADLLPEQKLLTFLEDSRPWVQVEAAMALELQNYPELHTHLQGWIERYDADDFRHFLALEVASRIRSKGDATGP